MMRHKKNTIRKKYSSQAVLIIILSVILIFFVKNYYGKKNQGGDPNEIISDKTRAWYKTILEVKEKIEEAVKIKPVITMMNKDQKVYNIDLYTGNLSSIIVVTVYTEVYNLDILISSLRKVKGIEKSLIIFAHSVFDNAVNVIIQQRVTFARYIQIYYPYSTQIYPTIFPGPDPSFCPKTYDCVKDIKRYTALAQAKHFWWWKMNYVFDNLDEVKNFNEYIIIIDEDNYVVEDFIHMIKLYTRQMPSQCNMICLGCHSADLNNYNKLDDRSVIEEFGTTNYSMGIGLNRTTWRRIKDLKKAFCQYNDYSWYKSLIYLSNLNVNPKMKFTMISSKGARVLPLGKCLDSAASEICTLQDGLLEITTFVDLIKDDLYPKSIKIEMANSVAPTKFEDPGYSVDARDIDLCMHISKIKRL